MAAAPIIAAKPPQLTTRGLDDEDEPMPPSTNIRKYRTHR
jgi:hypothetical protein